jgi:hypothetical protein
MEWLGNPVEAGIKLGGSQPINAQMVHVQCVTDEQTAVLRIGYTFLYSSVAQT